MEWKRVFWNRKGIFLLIFLLFANGVTYHYYLQNDQDEFVIGEEEYEQYIEDYPGKVRETIENGERLSTFSVFREKDSFAQVNIEKTARDYSRVKDVKPVRLDNQHTASLFSYEWVHIYVFAFGIWLILVFAAERKKSMDILLHTCRKGRMNIFIVRCIMLFIGMAVCSFFLYLSMYGMAVWKFGQVSLSVPVQSFPMMEKVTLPYTVIEFMFTAFWIQAAGSILTVMVFWLIICRIRSIEVGICLYTLLMGVEYILFSTVGIQSNLCVLRYANLFFSFQVTELWETYFNVRIGDLAVSNMDVFLYFLFIFWVISVGFLLISAVKGYPVRATGAITRFMEKGVELVRKKMAGFPVVFWELYKILWCQRGIVIFILFVWIMWGTVDHSQMFFTAEQEYINAFFDTNAGPVTEQKLEKMEDDALLNEHYDHVMKKMSDGWDVWLVNERGYEVLVGEESDTRRSVDGFLAGISILFLVSASFTYERKCGMVPLLRGAERGQQWLFHRKHMAADLVTLAVWGIMVLTEWERVADHYTLNCLGAPVQSLPFLSCLTIHISLGGFLAMIALTELLILYTFKNIILYFSVICAKVQLVVVIGMLVLIPNVWMETLIVKGVVTDAAFYVRCAEASVLVVANIILYRVELLKWKKV